MTRKEIFDLRVGNELNVLIAENIYGYKHLIGGDVPKEHRCLSARTHQEVWINEKGQRYCKWCGDMPEYSVYIEPAWEVHQHMLSNFFSKRQKYLKALQEVASGCDETVNIRIAWPDVLSVLRNDMPEAICKAALLVAFNHIEL